MRHLVVWSPCYPPTSFSFPRISITINNSSSFSLLAQLLKICLEDITANRWKFHIDHHIRSIISLFYKSPIGEVKSLTINRGGELKKVKGSFASTFTTVQPSAPTPRQVRDLNQCFGTYWESEFVLLSKVLVQEKWQGVRKPKNLLLVVSTCPTI